MPPTAKSRLAHEDSRSTEGSTVRERQIAAAAHARKSKNGASTQRTGTTLKELALASTQTGDAEAPVPGAGVSKRERKPFAYSSSL